MTTVFRYASFFREGVDSIECGNVRPLPPPFFRVHCLASRTVILQMIFLVFRSQLKYGSLPIANCVWAARHFSIWLPSFSYVPFIRTNRHHDQTSSSFYKIYLFCATGRETINKVKMLSFVGRSGSLTPFFTATTQLLANPAKGIVPCVLEKAKVDIQMDVDPKKPTLVTGKWRIDAVLNPRASILYMTLRKFSYLFRCSYFLQKPLPRSSSPFRPLRYSGGEKAAAIVVVAVFLYCFRAWFIKWLSIHNYN